MFRTLALAASYGALFFMVVTLVAAIVMLCVPATRAPALIRTGAYSCLGLSLFAAALAVGQIALA